MAADLYCEMPSKLSLLSSHLLERWVGLLLVDIFCFQFNPFSYLITHWHSQKICKTSRLNKKCQKRQRYNIFSDPQRIFYKIAWNDFVSYKMWFGGSTYLKCGVVACQWSTLYDRFKKRSAEWRGSGVSGAMQWSIFYDRCLRYIYQEQCRVGCSVLSTAVYTLR